MLKTAAAARRERGRQEMRETILDAARQILTEQGGDALSMRAVARAIGYSPAALYEYFPAKEDLQASLYFEGAGGLEGCLQSTLASLPPESTAVGTLTALGHAYRAYAREQPELFRLIFFRSASAITIGPPADHQRNGAFGALFEVVARGIENGEFVAVPPPVLALAAWSAVHGFVVLELGGHLAGATPPARVLAEGHAAPTLDQLYATIVDLFVSGIQRR